jgi:plastocyanin
MIGLSLAVAIVLAGASVVARTSSPAGSITGTVKATGQSNNADAVVYVEHSAGPFASPAPAVMDQRGMKFVPRVLGVLVGTTVKFNNSDTVSHNVFSPDHEKYQLGTWAPGGSKDHAFATCAKSPCVYAQLCLIHPEMEGFVLVLQNPYFATTDATGQFKIEGVPPGTYQVTVWHPKLKGQPKPVTVEAGKATTVDFTLGR